MYTTATLDRRIPEFISDNQLAMLIKPAHKYLREDEQMQLLNLAGLPHLALEKRILSRLVRITFISNSDIRKAKFILLLEKGIVAYQSQTSNLLSYEQNHIA